ncbi:MAG: SIS domain-containing protein [Proteobacteria bacterium]|nr:SIS domain-containing protein [Pseudomonadota bacterium]
MLKRFKEILEAEARAIQNIPLSDSVNDAVEALIKCKGKVFTTGIGKAGYVASKTASTMSTTGTPSVFLHPGDAPHGDVGVVQAGDVLIAFSNSGQTREVIETIHFCRHLGIDKIIAVTAKKDSELGKLADVVLEIGVIEEPCPFRLTPTASVAAMIAITDALALTVMEKRGFTREDFAVRHHGGYLGKKSREDG